MEDDDGKFYIIDLDESKVELVALMLEANVSSLLYADREFRKELEELKFDRNLFSDDEVKSVVRDVMMKSVVKGKDYTDGEVLDAALKRMRTWARRRINALKKKQQKS